MEVRLEGTGGPAGWPVPGCGCASCGRLAPGRRGPTSIFLDRWLRLPPSGEGDAVDPPRHGYHVTRTGDGWEIVSPDAVRVLVAVSGGDRDPHPGAAYPVDPFDLVLVDLLDQPTRLGELRSRGRVTPSTPVIAVGLDHRAGSEHEVHRRLGFWRATAVPDGTVLRVAPGRVTPPSGVAVPDPPRRTLVLGGARSGKSEEAELRVAADPRVTYVATGPTGDGDPAWLARIASHRARRPAHWRTVESVDLVAILDAEGPTGTLLIDGIGTWLAAVFDTYDAWHEGPGARVMARCDELVAAWRRTRARVVAVSDEVGLGVVPATASGRVFRDTLGQLNQRLARESEDVALVVAGRVMSLPG